MKTRCLNEKCADYYMYGGRGISICKRWMLFENFFADMGPRPIGKTLDRINSNKGYSKKNCRWASVHQQAKNRRNCVFITINGKRNNLVTWLKILKIKKATYKARVARGWSRKDALIIEVKR